MLSAISISLPEVKDFVNYWDAKDLRMKRIILVVILLTILLTKRSQSFMGWFGNGGKKPNGRRSLIKVGCDKITLTPVGKLYFSIICIGRFSPNDSTGSVSSLITALV